MTQAELAQRIGRTRKTVNGIVRTRPGYLPERRAGWTDCQIAQLVKLGILTRRADPVTRLREVLNFFGVASLQALERIGADRRLAFRQSMVHDVDQYALLAWLRLGEIQARRIQCEPYDVASFRKALIVIRTGWAAPARNLAANCVWGVTQWVSPEKAILQLSLRGRTGDQFWFTFFH